MFSLIKHLSNCAAFAQWASSGHRSGRKRDHKSEITNPQGAFSYPGRETLCDQLFRRRSVAVSVSDSGRAVLAVCVQRRRRENQSEPDLRSPAAQEGPAAAKPAGQRRAEVRKSHFNASVWFYSICKVGFRVFNVCGGENTGFLVFYFLV